MDNSSQITDDAFQIIFAIAASLPRDGLSDEVKRGLDDIVSVARYKRNELGTWGLHYLNKLAAK